MEELVRGNTSIGGLMEPDFLMLPSPEQKIIGEEKYSSGTLQSYVWVLIVLGVMVIVAVLISVLYVKHKRSCHPSSKDAEGNHLLIEIEDTHI
ncbi:hypothetical protein EB796_011069 [Bugula neritina]|uniref:Uncharacterized protein n=1 Tax=Bugula neritina TaxID=10212 RepID=A0A7J7JW90_BUGNE|nr:hypothetical protein EB796_011069 [Bugula neritina]